MKRTGALLAMALVLAACDGTAEDAVRSTTDVSSTTDGADETSDQGTTQEEGDADDAAAGADDTDADAGAPDEGADDSQSPTDDPAADGPSIDSLDDIPAPCRELMAEFLVDIEPIVSAVDWQSATLTDFEQVSGDFEARADEFDAESTAQGCDDLDFEDDAGFGLIIEFADDVAPGVIPFFEFLDSMMGNVTPIDAAPTAGELQDCQDVVDGIQQLMVQYEAFSDVPVTELAKFADMAALMPSCTPEQLSALDSPEMTEFLSR